jgi:imidazolonepropionase
MSSRLLTHIKQLVNVRAETRPLYGKEMAELPGLDDAWLLIEENEIAGFGKMDTLKKDLPNRPTEQTDCSGRLVLPCWCDSHTHLVYTGSRENEFTDKIRGLSYAEINARGGGILNTVQKVNEISEDTLFQESWKRLEEVARQGTGAIEIKSGYGLSLDGELKMLRVIKKLKQKSSLQIRSTFLGAHTYPLVYRENHAAYIREIVEEMLPVIAKEKLADYIDVFCEKGFFNPEESEIILRAGMRFGLQPKMHVNQLHAIGGIETGIRLNALSMDHLETMPDEDISRIKNSGWKGFCTLLPTAAFFLRLPWPPARLLLDSGCAVALASDYNPGSSPTGNMNSVIAMACIQMKLLPEEALNAATINGAYAMGLGNSLGSVTKGKKANLIITSQVPSLAYLPYSFGSDLVDKVMIQGNFVA